MACTPPTDQPTDQPQDVEVAQNARKRIKIRAVTGTLTDVESLDVPDAVKTLLRELDMDDSGEVSEQNLLDSLKIMKQLKSGLDADGSGGITNKEMEEGVELLTRLLEAQSHNQPEMEYKHLPPCIQEVMREWDADGSGKVGAGELGAAAQAYKKIQQEGRMMRRIILAMAIVILILMASMFVLSYAAVDMAKEMRGSDDGVMSNPNGEVVKLASSDFELTADGSLIIRGSDTTNATCPPGEQCRRLGAARGAGSLKVASSETPRRLSSTLPDAAFKELKSLTLKDSGEGMVKVNINSFQRMKLKSSRCGSVVQLISGSGVLTLDDYEMSADAAMEEHVANAGMAGLFDGGGVGGFGRRLSSTDGMLEGFFNLLDDVEWACESVELPAPDALPQFYHARIRVKHLHENPAAAHSYHFMDVDGTALELAGVVTGDDGRIYKTWEEDLVKAGGVTAYKTQFDMTPFMSELRVKRAGSQLRMECMGSVGYRCLVDDVGKSAMAAAAGASDGPTMEFVGVVVEHGVVLRHWRMHTVSDKESESDDSDDTGRAMVEAGMIPNTVDYYDVDTDPEEKFESGQPYRIVMFSTVQGSKVFTEKQYLSIRALPATFELEGVMDLFNISKVDTECALSKEVKDKRSARELVRDTSFLHVTNRSLNDPNFSMPPPMHPWSEMMHSVRVTYKKLARAYAHDPSNPALKRALATDYWTLLLKLKENKDVIMPPPDDSDDGNFTGGGRRYNRRLGTTQDDDGQGSYRWTYNSADKEATRAGALKPGHEARRLAQERRLGATSWAFGVDITPEKIDINIEIGSASLEFLVQYCNLYNPTGTNWGACQTGRAGAGQIVKMEGYASGKQVVWPWPTVSLEMGGLLVYDDTSALGCVTGEKVFMTNPSTRGKNLEDRNGVLGMHEDKGGYQKFHLVHASGSTFGQDQRFWIVSHRDECLADHDGVLKFTSDCQGWEKWRILDAGSGAVYFQSHRGKFLGVEETGPEPEKKKCKIILYRNSDCSGGTKVLESTDPNGQIFHFDDDNWESAKAEGDCFQTEFFDEDNDEPEDEDNIWHYNTFGCTSFPYDLDDDMSGMRIFAGAPVPGPWEGRMKLYDSKVNAARWLLRKEEDDSLACSSGDALLYGGLTFKKEIDIILGFGASFTTELGAAGAIHPYHGAYLAEVYGKGIVEFGIVQIYLLLKFNPNDPWITKYKDWTMCAATGYEVDTFFYTYRDEYEIHCADLDFR